jgi:hypothetical protein
VGIEMEKAEQLASELFFRSLSAWNRVYKFRYMAQLGLPHATAITDREHHQWAHEFAYSEEYAKIFRVDRAELIEKGYFEGFAATLTDQAVATYEASLDAACLIFAHSLLDSTVLEWCRVCSLARPADFLPQIGQKRVAIADMEKAPWPELLQRAVADHFDILARESLVRKLDLLFSLCQPPADFEGIVDYRYDRNRIIALDALRHRYVHGDDLSLRLPSGDDDIVYLQKTSMFLMSLVHQRYGIRIDPGAMHPSSWRGGA